MPWHSVTMKKKRKCRQSKTYGEDEAEEEERGGDHHDGEADQHEGLAPGFLDHDQREHGHQHVHGTHAQGGALRGRLVQTSRFEDRGRVEHGLGETKVSQST